MSAEQHRAALERVLTSVRHTKQLGPDLLLLQPAHGNPMMKVSDAMLARLPGWCVACRPKVVREDEFLRHYWGPPVDRALLVAEHAYMMEHVYVPMWERFSTAESMRQYPTIDDYSRAMLQKAEWDFQDAAPKQYALYCNFKVLGPW